MTRPRSLELVVPGGVRPLRGTVEETPRQPPVPTSPAGAGVVEVVRGAAGRSCVSRAYATSPLRLLTPVNHGHAAWLYTSSYGGGLVDGDCVSLDVAVGRGASAYISTQASTKVYRSERGTESQVRAHVGRDAMLVLAPDPVVCFSRARYRQRQAIALEPGAGLVLVDWLTSGRRAAGERWRFHEYVAHTEVRVEGRLAIHDTLSLRAEHGDLQARLGRFDVLALVVLTGAPLEADARAVMGRVGSTPVVRRAELAVSAAPLRTGGCAVRIAGPSAERVGALIEQLLDFVPRLLGDNPWSRKW